MGPATPCVAVAAASTPQQQIYHLTLHDLFAEPHWPAPAVLIIGKVAAQAKIKLPTQPHISPQEEILHTKHVEVSPQEERLLSADKLRAQHASLPQNNLSPLAVAHTDCHGALEKDGSKENSAPSRPGAAWRRLMWSFAEAWYG
jgi:hypothetical protein